MGLQGWAFISLRAVSQQVLLRGQPLSGRVIMRRGAARHPMWALHHAQLHGIFIHQEVRLRQSLRSRLGLCSHGFHRDVLRCSNAASPGSQEPDSHHVLHT